MTKASIISLIEQHGIMPTTQRVQLAEILFERRQHMAADQLLLEANRKGYRVSKATVYNTLGLFARKGLVREVVVDPTRVYYDSNTAHHHHFYNEDTGALLDIPVEKLRVMDLPELPEGTELSGVDVVVRVRGQECDEDGARAGEATKQNL